MILDDTKLGESLFVQLTPTILLEYTYSATGTPNEIPATVGSPTAVGNFIRFKNNYPTFQGTYFLCNTPGTATNNVQKYHVLPISRTQWVDNSDTNPIQWTTQDQIILKQYIAPLLPNSIDVVYDRVRVHFAAGWNFGENDGIIVYVQAADKNWDQTTLASLKIRKSENWAIMNPKAFIYGEAYYDSFIEFMVPNVSYLNYQYDITPEVAKNDTIAYHLSLGTTGFYVGKSMSLGIQMIDRVVKKSGFDSYITSDHVSTVIPQANIYSSLSAKIEKSIRGNFFEYSMADGGNSIENFILQLNSIPGNKYVLSHRIRVFEQVGLAEYETTSFTTQQTSNFDKPFKFRPVLEYSHISPAYSIEYDVTLYNQGGGLSVNRKATITRTDGRKYGPEPLKIEINAEDPKKVYNVIKDGPKITIQQTVEAPTTTKYVPTYFERVSIHIGLQRVYVDPTGAITSSTSPNSKAILENGAAVIHITPFNNHFKITLYDRKNKVMVPLPISAIPYYLVFIDDNNSKLYVQNRIDISIANASVGELYFKLTTEISEKVLKFKDDRFFLVCRESAAGAESQVYQGTWTSKPEVFTEVVDANTTDVVEAVNPVQVDKTTSSDLTANIIPGVAVEDTTLSISKSVKDILRKKNINTNT